MVYESNNTPLYALQLKIIEKLNESPLSFEYKADPVPDLQRDVASLTRTDTARSPTVGPNGGGGGGGGDNDGGGGNDRGPDSNGGGMLGGGGDDRRPPSENRGLGGLSTDDECGSAFASRRQDGATGLQPTTSVTPTVTPSLTAHG